MQEGAEVEAAGGAIDVQAAAHALAVEGEAQVLGEELAGHEGLGASVRGLHLPRLAEDAGEAGLGAGGRDVEGAAGQERRPFPAVPHAEVLGVDLHVEQRLAGHLAHRAVDGQGVGAARRTRRGGVGGRSRPSSATQVGLERAGERSIAGVRGGSGLLGEPPRDGEGAGEEVEAERAAVLARHVGSEARLDGEVDALRHLAALRLEPRRLHLEPALLDAHLAGRRAEAAARRAAAQEARGADRDLRTLASEMSGRAMVHRRRRGLGGGSEAPSPSGRRSITTFTPSAETWSIRTLRSRSWAKSSVPRPLSSVAVHSTRRLSPWISSAPDLEATRSEAGARIPAELHLPRLLAPAAVDHPGAELAVEEDARRGEVEEGEAGGADHRTEGHPASAPRPARRRRRRGERCCGWGRLHGLFLGAHERAQRLVGLLGREAAVHHPAHRLDHGLGCSRLEDVAAHVHAGGALGHGVGGQAQRVELRAASCRRR